MAADEQSLLNNATLRALVAAPGDSPRDASLDELIADNLVPSDLAWQPSSCIRTASGAALIHLLATPSIPPYIQKAIEQIKETHPAAKVLILAKSLLEEAADPSGSSRIVPAPYVASAVAEQAVNLGCGLAFQDVDSTSLVFPSGYKPPSPCMSDEETGHVPHRILEELDSSSNFSPYLKQLFSSLGKTYNSATKGRKITNNREAKLLMDFAESFAKGDCRLFFPLGQLHVLKEYEAAKANRKTRDHFFHTFNNLFLGFVILGEISEGREIMADVDRHIFNKTRPARLYPWESLWFLTCMFHDPAYIAEKFWGTFRFSYGVQQSSEDEDIPEQVKEKIKNLWDTEFAGPRRDLSDLYDRTVRKWVPPSIKSPSKSRFDEALQRAYFDGRVSSHSLVSGLRLINLCKSDTTVRASSYRPKIALAACEIAALCMMFHDPRCRAILGASGIPPIAFEHLPYAAVLMYVDALQDDRRNISESRFRKHGVLIDLNYDRSKRAVLATVCLPEVSVDGWPGRIAEYRSIEDWINTPETVFRFLIDFRGKAGL